MPIPFWRVWQREPQQWDFSSFRDRPTTQKKGGLYSVRDDVKARIEALNRKVEDLVLSQNLESATQVVQTPEQEVFLPMHASQMSPSFQGKR